MPELYDICTGIAHRMGVAEKFTKGRSHDEWVEHMYHQCRELRPELPASYQEAVQTGIFKWNRGERPLVGLQAFRENPEQAPLNTPSGKIEIFSRRLWDIGRSWKLPEGDVISAVAEYHATWGMPADVRAQEYPLQLVGYHCKQRTHSSYGNNPWLEEAVPPESLDQPPGCRGPRHRPRRYRAGFTIRSAKPGCGPGLRQDHAGGSGLAPRGAWYTPDKKRS